MEEKIDSKINKVVETAIKNINEITNVNTVIGEQIKTSDGDYIIPFSKITVGILCGGGEYGKVSIFKSGSDLPFSAGNGAIVSLKPSGFLIKDKNGNFKLLSSDNSYDKLIDKAEELIEKIKNEN